MSGSKQNGEVTTVPKPHPPEHVKAGVCTLCWRPVKTKAGAPTRCAPYTRTTGYPERRTGGKTK